MKILTYPDFRNNLAESLDAVNNNREVIIVSRSKGKKVAVMDLNEYNSIRETLHLTSTPANRKRLYKAIAEMNKSH